MLRDDSAERPAAAPPASRSGGSPADVDRGGRVAVQAERLRRDPHDGAVGGDHGALAGHPHGAGGDLGRVVDDGAGLSARNEPAGRGVGPIEKGLRDANLQEPLA